VHVIRSEVVLPPPVENQESWRGRLEMQESDFVACMLGHLHQGKDHETLLRAWRIVSDRLRLDGRRALLLLAGRPAGSEDDVKALAFDLDLRDHLRFLGDVADVSGLLEVVDIGVFSSQSEAFGRGATEPMSAGLAVVATDVPGIREAVGEPGRELLARPADAESLAAGILRLALDPVLRESIGRANAELMRERQTAEPTSRAYALLIASGLAGTAPAAELRDSPSPSRA
jgi:glycosyltransferase involved in cell wall biosynthesis